MYQKKYISTLPIVQLSFNTRSRFDQRSMVYHVFNKNVKRCPSTTFRRLSTRIGLRIAKMFCIRKENKMSSFLQLYMSEKCEYYIFLGSDLWWLLDQKLEVVTLLKFAMQRQRPDIRYSEKCHEFFCQTMKYTLLCRM